MNNKATYTKDFSITVQNIFFHYVSQRHYLTLIRLILCHKAKNFSKTSCLISKQEVSCKSITFRLQML